MDKPQKELMKSYFRNRELAAQQSNSTLLSYETKYLIDSGEIDIKNLTEDDIYYFLMDYPDYFDKIAAVNNFDEMDYYIQTQLAMKHPQLINKFNWKRKWKGMSSEKKEAELIAKYPEAIDLFDLSEYMGDDIATIVVAHPEMAERFEKDIKGERDGYISWRSDDISKILDVRPDLKDWFKYGYMDGAERLKLLYYHPEVIENLFALYREDQMRKVYYADVKKDYKNKEDINFDDLIKKHPQLEKYFEYMWK